MQLTLPEFKELTTAKALAHPSIYRGLYAFHKYWGKKPHEPVCYLIQNLSPEYGLVVDPFLGSGISAVEALHLKRRFIGVDINPIAVRLSRLLVSPPSVNIIEEAFERVASRAKNAILETYTTTQQKPATHYVWRNGVIEMVWLLDEERGIRIELPPDEHDLALAESFAAYQPKRLRAPRFFTNPWINSSSSLTLKDLFYRPSTS